MEGLFKKMLLCVSAVLLVCGCSSGAPSTSEQEQIPAEVEENNENASNESTSDDLMKFENVILMDDDNVTVELVNFYAKEVNWNTGKRNDKNITLKVTNKSDRKFLFDLLDTYIGSDEINVIMHDGNSGPAPGKSASFSYCIYHDEKPNPKELESLELLKELEGVIQIYKYDANGDKLEDHYETAFKIADALNGVTAGVHVAEESERITSVLTQFTKWEIDDSTGLMVFKNDGTGSFKSQLGDLDMIWEINDDLSIHTSFEYNGTKYGATYNLKENGGSYALENVKDSSKVFKPIE